MLNSLKIMQWKVIILLVVLKANAQSDVIRVLHNFTEDSILLQLDQRIAMAYSQDFSIPWIKSIEGRFGINGSTAGDTVFGYLRNEDNYGLIVRFNSFSEIASQKKYKSKFIQVLEADKKDKLNRRINECYSLVGSLYYLKNEVAWLEEKERLLQGIQEVHKSMVDQGLTFQLKDILVNEEDIIKNSSELNQQRTRMNELIYLLGIPVESIKSESFKFGDWINVQSMINKINNLKYNAALNSSLNLKIAQSELAEAKVSNVKAQNSEILDGIRLSFDDVLYPVKPNKFNPMNNYSVRIGFKVPLTGNNNFRLADAYIESYEKKSNIKFMEWENQDQLKVLKDKAENLYSNYQKLEQQMMNSATRKLISNPKAKEHIAPMDWYRMKLIELEINLKKNSIADELAKVYLEILNYCGILTDRIQIFSETEERW